MQDSNDPAGQEKLIKLNIVLANLVIFRNASTSRTWSAAWSKTGPALPVSRRYPARHPDADGYDQLLTCKPERYRLLPRPGTRALPAPQEVGPWDRETDSARRLCAQGADVPRGGSWPSRERARDR